MPRAAIRYLRLGAIGMFWLYAFALLAQGPLESSKHAALDLKSDPRLKVLITTNFKKPKVPDLLDSLEKATRLKFSTNEMVEISEEAFGSVSFRNTPAWIVMQELVKSDAVKGHWEKTDNGYRLVGTLDAKSRQTRVAALRKYAPIAEQTAEPPTGSSGQCWLVVAILAIPAAVYVSWLVVHRWRRSSQSSGKST